MPTTAGPVQVDVLEVTDDDLADLPDDPTDRLHVLSHAWAATSATPVTIRAADLPNLTVAVAEPGPLIAMKLQSIMNRGSGCAHAIDTGAERLSTDLLDGVGINLGNVPGRDHTAGEVPNVPPRPARSGRKSKPRNTVFDDHGTAKAGETKASPA